MTTEDPQGSEPVPSRMTQTSEENVYHGQGTLRGRRGNPAGLVLEGAEGCGGGRGGGANGAGVEQVACPLKVMVRWGRLPARWVEQSAVTSPTGQRHPCLAASRCVRRWPKSAACGRRSPFDCLPRFCAPSP